MGLAISRTIVEAHQGRFVVESEPGVRTTFRFLLPVDTEMMMQTRRSTSWMTTRTCGTRCAGC